MKDGERKASPQDEIRVLKADVIVASERIRRQAALIRELNREGHATSLARKLAAILEDASLVMLRKERSFERYGLLAHLSTISEPL